jgi:hypothetical protein
MRASGFLFLSILVLYFTKMGLGNKDTGDYDSDAELQKIYENQTKFKISIVVALIHHISVVTLAIMLFIAFSPYNILLGIIWTTFRIGEGLILLYNEKSYWGFLNLARQYSGTSGAEKNSVSGSARITFQSKVSRFTLGMFFWSIGTLAFSIVLVIFGVVPALIGWLGIVAGVLVAIYNGMILVKQTDITALAIGGLSAILFEVLLGVWLLFFTLTIP